MILREFVNRVYYSLFLPWSWLKILAADDVSQHRKWYRVRCHVLDSFFDIFGDLPSRMTTNFANSKSFLSCSSGNCVRRRCLGRYKWSQSIWNGCVTLPENGEAHHVNSRLYSYACHYCKWLFSLRPSFVNISYRLIALWLPPSCDKMSNKRFLSFSKV